MKMFGGKNENFSWKKWKIFGNTNENLWSKK